LEFTLAPGTEPASLGQTRAAFAGDLDGDDRADVILATQDIANKRPQVFVFTGVGEDNIDPTTDSAFAEGILVEVPSAGVDAEAIDAALFDSDEDGDLDVALLVVETVLDAGQNAFPLSSVIVLENQGDGTLLDLGRRTVLSVVHDGALGTQDLDGDGVTDLCVLGSGALGRITLLIGRGDGSFAIGSTGIVGREAASLEIADVDRDNVPDIVVFTESYDEMLTITTDGNGNLIRWTR
ncbi:MAG: FG-GAP repeat domain-containing protein, partial [Planctomycetota bacterium]